MAKANVPLIADFEINSLPQTVNAIGRMHWAVKLKESRRWKLLVYQQCILKRIIDLKLQKCSLEFIRFSSVEPDFDNLVSSFKHVIDGLISAGVIQDDRPSFIGSPNFKWERVKRGSGKIRVSIFSPEPSLTLIDKP